MTMICRICGHEGIAFGSHQGLLRKRLYHFAHCPVCHFTWVTDPDSDLSALYDQAYYEGRGADPCTNYIDEMMYPQHTTRQLEWQGIVELVAGLYPLGSKVRWLDYGCGHGGLVRYVAERRLCQIEGFDIGWIVDRARQQGISVLSQDQIKGQTYDIVTAIEVLEHVSDPLNFLRNVRQLLKPGGLFFLMTGNSEPFLERFTTWRYVAPEIHVSYFCPGSLRLALETCGLRPEFFSGFPKGYEKVITHRLLKTLGFRRMNPVLHALPLHWAAPLIERRYQLSRQPFARG